MNTFNSLCIGACIFMIFLGFSFSFIDAMGAFPTSKESPDEMLRKGWLKKSDYLIAKRLKRYLE